MTDPKQILEAAYRRAIIHLSNPVVDISEIIERIAIISRNTQNRAGVRLGKGT